MNTHPLNVSYLVMGLIFLGISGSWALRASGVVDVDWSGYLVPITLVAAGVIGLVATAVRGLLRRRRATSGATDEPTSESTGTALGAEEVGWAAYPGASDRQASPDDPDDQHTDEHIQVLPTTENRGESR